MVDIRIQGPTDLAAYEDEENTRVRFDGALELASDNEVSNADMKQLRRNGTPVGAQMGCPDEPQGWAVFVKQLLPLPPGLATRQSLPVLPMQHPAYRQNGPLIRGPALPDRNERADIASPPAPTLDVITDAQGGFEVGWMAVSYGWIGADAPKPEAAHVHRSPYLTLPGPRAYIQITNDGECPVIPVAAIAPKGAVGIYLCATEPQPSQNAASTAQMFILRRIDIRDGQQLTFTLGGPMSRDERVPTENKSKVGAFQRWRAPDHKYVHSDGGVMYSFDTKLTFRFATSNGISLCQNETEKFTSRHIGEKRALRFEPVNLPDNAIKWQPIFANEKTYIGLPWRSVDEHAQITSIDPAKIKQKTETVPYTNKGNDGTGLPDPAEEIEEVTKVGKPQLPLGEYRVWAAWYDENLRLSAPSPAGRIYDSATDTYRIKAVIDTLGKTFRVKRPQIGNAIPNAQGQMPDRTTANKDPLEWEIDRTTFSSVTTDIGQIIVKDNSSNNTVKHVAKTPLVDILEEEPDDRWFRIRMGVKVDRYVGGRVMLRVIYLDKNKTVLGTSGQLAGVGATTTGTPTPKVYSLHEVVYAAAVIGKMSAVAPPGVTVDDRIPVAARYFRVELLVVGEDTGVRDGRRNLDFTLTALGALRGLTTGRTIPRIIPPYPDLENFEDDYPVGGVAAIEENPANRKRHIDLWGQNLNAFIYFGAYGTPPNPDYGISGFPTPVKPGSFKRYSIYAEYEGVSVPTDALRLVCRDRAGRITQDYGYLVNNAHGSLAPTRFTKGLAIPNDGVSVEIAEGNLSDGFWRIMAPMQQRGSGLPVLTWTNNHAPEGSRSWVIDTGVPGCVEGSSNEWMSAVQSIIDWSVAATEGSDGTDPDYSGTQVTATFQSSPTYPAAYWSAPHARPQGCPPGRYFRVSIAMSTSNLNRSPLLTATGIELARPYGVLCRFDGSEFPNGGCRLGNFPAIDATRLVTEFISDSNVWQQFVSGEWLYRLPGLRLICESREAAEAVSAYRYTGRPYVIESWLRNRQLRAFVSGESAISWAASETGVEADPYAPDGYWEEQVADGVEFVVIDEDTLRPETNGGGP